MKNQVQVLSYPNPYYKKMRRAYPMRIRCAACSEDLVMYQKGGKGGLIKLRIDRILSTSFPLEKDAGALYCPNCRALFAKGTVYKGHVHFFVMRGAVHTKSYY